MTNNQTPKNLHTDGPFCSELRGSAEPPALDDPGMDHLVACNACRTYFAARTCD